ncbi:uncharacterized protein LOC122658271 [Telopea speciosissima]|uniref:uncharacterized protein LOC122658271 n=1 Tax=Telopea speciosissima TaxID=54955 RepID=UPI001CC4D25E|nr:uncharacterized protein LOC122658271 [Telopea speciosissima]
MASDTVMKKSGGAGEAEVLDGSDIMELVGNEKVFSNYVNHKFEELDQDRDGKLSVKELQPAVADLGGALGLPAQGTSPDSDHIYSEVLQQFTHGKQETVSKTEFKKVLSDILLGMAAGLKRDPVVILKISGEDLKEFINGPRFEPEIVSIFSQIQTVNGSLRDYIIKALEQLKVDHGMPPSTDSWVASNIVEPVLQSCAIGDQKGNVSQENFIEEFKKVALSLAQRLKEQPVIVAHSENNFEGSSIKRLLTNKFELDKSLDAVVRDLPKDRHNKVSKEYLRIALDLLAPTAGLPPLGAVDQMDKVISEAFTLVNADDGKAVSEEEFKKFMTQILGSIMLQLEGVSISVSSNSVVHETLSTSSTLLPSSTS